MFSVFNIVDRTTVTPQIKDAKKIYWSNFEKESLKLIVEGFLKNCKNPSEIEWIKVSKALEEKGVYRSNHQCRSHWTRAGDPKIDKSALTDKEKQIIVEAVNTHGYQWTVISNLLERRTSLVVEAFYRSHQKKILGGLSKTIEKKKPVEGVRRPEKKILPKSELARSAAIDKKLPLLVDRITFCDPGDLNLVKIPSIEDIISNNYSI